MSPPSSNRVAFIPAFAAGLIYALICIPPWVPTFLTGAEYRDPSWRYMLHEGFVRNLEFGRDIIFTYGPWGFLTTRMYHPETYSLMLAVWVGIAVLFHVFTWKLARQYCSSPWAALLICVIAVRVVFVEALICLFAFVVMLLAHRLAAAVNVAEHSSVPSSGRVTWTVQTVLTGLLLLTVGGASADEVQLCANCPFFGCRACRD